MEKEIERGELNKLLSQEEVYKKLRKRGVWFNVMTYAPAEVIEYACSRALHWAYIYHNRDTFDILDIKDGVSEEQLGALKEPHYHVLLHYDIARSGLAVLKDFPSEQNTRVEIADQPIASYEYLTHKNHPNKYQYNDYEIISHNRDYWVAHLPRARDRPSNTDLEADFISDLLGEKEPDLVYMARKYGRDFIKNHRSYLDFRDAVRYQNKLISFKEI